jgi:hypothetical protein
MMAMDHRTAAIDYGGDPRAKYRPGHRRADQASVDRCETAYGEACKKLTDAWRTPARIEADNEAAAIAARDEVMAADDAHDETDVLEQAADLVLEITLDLDQQRPARQQRPNRVAIEVLDAHLLKPAGDPGITPC